MEFGKWKLKDAAHEMVMKRFPHPAVMAGLIAVDKEENIAMPFCTEGMYRGFIKNDAPSAQPRTEVKIYKE